MLEMFHFILFFQIWSLSSLPLPSPTPTAPTSPHLTVLWDVAGQMKSHDSRTPHDLNKMYHSQRAITCRATPTVLAAANGVMVVGLSDGRVQLYECAVKGEGCLQEFADHKAAITDMYVVSLLCV